MSKDYVMQLEATIENLRRDNQLLKEELAKYKAIDNTNPNEALKCLEEMYEKLYGLIYCDYENGYYRESEYELVHSEIIGNYNTIKNCILKTQESKQYLTWEDLEKDRIYKVLLNGSQYELVKRFDDYEYHCDYITLQKKPNVSIFIYECDKEIFNDLRLERAEE